MTLYLNLSRALYPLPYLVSYLGIDERGRRIRMFTATLTCERATRANLASCVYEGETAPASELPPGAALEARTIFSVVLMESSPHYPYFWRTGFTVELRSPGRIDRDSRCVQHMY